MAATRRALDTSRANPGSLACGLGAAGLLALAICGGCTPPRVEERPAATARRSDRHGGPHGPPSREGAAAGSAGVAVFATSDEMFKSLAQLAVAPAARGARTVRLSEGDEAWPGTGEESRERDAQRAVAVRSRSGRVRGARVDVEPRGGGSFHVRVTSEVLLPGGEVRHEVREGTLLPPEAPEPRLVWDGPPRSEP